MSESITAFKGFDKDWSCRGFKYEIGKTYKEKGPIALCKSGFHACEAPLDIWGYYPPINGNAAAQVDLIGVSEEKGEDTKRVGSSIVVKAALSIADLVKAQIEWTSKRAEGKKVASGDYSKAASSG